MALKYAVKSGNWSDSDVWGIKLTGTVSFTNGDDTVTGNGTTFTSELSSGDKIFGADGIWYTVNTITDDTTLKLSEAYGGSSVSDVESYKQTSYPTEGDSAKIKENVTVYGESGYWVVGGDIGSALIVYGTFYIPNSISGDCTFVFKDDFCGLDVSSDGTLKIGDEENPITNKTVTFYFNYTSSIIGLRMLCNGNVYLYGEYKTGKTVLSETASAGSNQIIVDNAEGWKVGDTIVIVTTDNKDKSEEKTISAISGTTITLDSALVYTHVVGGYVLNLTRNIRFSYSSDSQKKAWNLYLDPKTDGIIKNVEFVFSTGESFDMSGNIMQINLLSGTNLTIENCSFQHVTYIDLPYRSNPCFLNLKDLVFYHHSLFETTATDQVQSEVIEKKKADNLVFLPLYYDASFIFSYGTWQNIVICDWMHSGTIVTLNGPVYIENMEIFGFHNVNPYSPMIIGTYARINNLTIGKPNSNYGYKQPIFSDLLCGEFTNCDFSNYLSSDGSIRIVDGDKAGRFVCNEVVYAYGGSFGPSSCYGLSGRNDNDCLVIDPALSDDYLYIPFYNENLFQHFVLQQPILPILFPVNSGKSITLSFWTKVTENGFDGELQIKAKGCGIDYDWTTVDLGSTSDWMQQSFTLGTTTSTGFIQLFFRAKNGENVSADICLDDFMITES